MLIIGRQKSTQPNPEQRKFAKYLLKLGNGELPENAMGEIELFVDILSNGHLIDEVFGNCLKKGKEVMKK